MASSQAHSAGRPLAPYSLYGLLGLPLAFVSLPLYVNLPRHYAEQYAMPLGTLGLLLLATRLLDAVLDPRIGLWVDRLFAQHARRSWGVAALASVVMAIGFAALWMPPSAAIQASSLSANPWPLLMWLGVSLVITYLAYSVVSIVHQTWGARWGGSADQRAKLVAWREGFALIGVLLASVLPAWLGLATTSWALVISLCVGLCALYATLPAHQASLVNLTNSNNTTGSCASDDGSPWSNPAFVALMVVFLINGTASAMPATLLPFFVRDTLQAASWEPVFLGSYFVAAAAGLPLWIALVKRIGLGRSWLCGMGLSILAFSAVPLLGPGDAWVFEAICILTGLALGADLAIPSALLTGVIHHAGLGQQSEGRFFGWWTGATKLNLALASGVALPLLGWAGYQTGADNPHNQMVLSLTYGLLPCVFKVLAATALWLSLRRHPVLKGQS